MARQTFYSVKYFKDAASTNHAVFISHSTDIIQSITPGSGIRVISERRFNFSEGHSEIVITYTGSGSVQLNFTSGTVATTRIEDVRSVQKLPVAFDALTRSFTFDKLEGENAYTISDALYYPETTKYRELVIFPESSNTHLDTSDRTDFYYLSDGSSPYTASTSLQNTFLNNIGYTNRGSRSEELGKFRGGDDDNTSLKFTTAHEVDSDGSGPTVRGEIKSISISAQPNQINVCTDPTATNYYLKGCLGESYPCTDSGVSHADTCDGTTLTSTTINSSVALPGGCCTYVDGCEDFAVATGNIVNADIDTANGSIDITITGGTANFTFSIDDISLENPSLIFNSGNPQTSSGITTNVFTVSSLLPGTYEITIGDSNVGTACRERITLTIPSDPDTNPDGDFGCKDTASAINHDSGAANHSDKACVFCDAVSGKLFADSTNPITLGPWVEEVLGTTQQSATSNPSGTSLSDGAITFQGVNFAAPYSVLPPPTPLNFDPSAQFTSSNQTDPFDYRLFLLDSGFNFSSVTQFISVGADALGLLTSNSTLVTTASTTGGSNTFTGLAAGTYAIAVVYDNDGTQDGDDEVEQCYEIFGTYIVGQGGCTDSNSTNFNPDATFDDGSCITEPSNNCDGAIDFPVTVHCNTATGAPVISVGSPLLGNNPGLIDAINNGFTITQGPAAGQFVDPAAPGTTALDIANLYIFSEIFCFEASDNPGLYDSNGNFLIQNALNGDTALINYLPSNFYIYARTNYTPGPGVMSSIIWNGGQDFTSFLLSDGSPNPSAQGNVNFPSGLSYIQMDIFLTMSDGTTLNMNPTIIGGGSTSQPMHEFFIPSNINSSGGPPSLQVPGSDFTISLPFYTSCNTPTPVSLTYSYNFGTFGVWEHTYSQTHTFTPAELNLMTACCDGIQNPVLGCTDPLADNYNPQATVDDGSCLYGQPSPILGCTDPTAINFNPNATIDDGSCQYPPSGGSWVCDNTTANCVFDTQNSLGFATQADCIANTNCGAVPSNNDCINLEDFGDNNNISIGFSTISGSTLNPTTGLCDDNETGALTFTIPDTTGLFPVSNPNGIIYIYLLHNTDTNQIFTSYNSGTFSPASFPAPQPGELGSATAVLPNDTSTTIIRTNLPSGNYQIHVFFYANAVTDLNGDIILPLAPGQGGGQDPTTDPITLGSCADMNNTTFIPLASCGGGIIYGCTDPDADNYDATATVDDGSCTYPPPPPPPGGCLCVDGTYDPSCCPPNPVGGCTDPNALNYNPGASFDDGSCEYAFTGCIEDCDSVETVIPACIPTDIDKLLEYNEECIARVSHRFYTKHVTGIGSSCSNMETMKMVIINDLMSYKGLPCIYNCTDAQTPDIGNAKIDCKESWQNAGSVFWSPANANTYTLGSIVARAIMPNPNNQPAVIYIAVSNSGLDVDPFSDSLFSGWKKCVTFNHTETETYLPNFIKFAREYCKDCGIPPYKTTGRNGLKPVFDTGTSGSSGTAVDDSISVGGQSVTINGGSAITVENTGSSISENLGSSGPI